MIIFLWTFTYKLKKSRKSQPLIAYFQSFSEDLHQKIGSCLHLLGAARLSFSTRSFKLSEFTSTKLPRFFTYNFWLFFFFFFTYGSITRYRYRYSKIIKISFFKDPTSNLQTFFGKRSLPLRNTCRQSGGARSFGAPWAQGLCVFLHLAGAFHGSWTKVFFGG